MRQQRPIAVIAELEGLPLDYCRKACTRLAAEHDIEYNPAVKATPASLTDASKQFRHKLGDMLYQFREAPGRHQLEVARDTGLTQAQQVKATERPYEHDWTLGQMERLARATDQDFGMMMLKGLLTPEQYRKVVKCLSS